MTAALVGPLQPVRYADGATEWHDLPRNTIDIRYSACGNHHLACDCREAALAETIGEYRAMYRELEQAITAAIEGHPTWAYSRDGYSEDEAGQCKCPVCHIARKCFVGYGAWSDARRAADSQLYPDQEVPF
jgi:hypothetical protein